ncbi:putative signal peptide protein [Sphaerotilus natans subsp. natans DSM 6575]|uniref:Putative signal peptide protein n=1 Tax=Sphaerotilus natans subsp. natans DSM 6575 TaxID=1286631 RepID=A0A059KSQ9_9BURK|nr:SPOR domain-containing protein [Sphaerotilus natans]KDB54405.1 putative signal peptide protein [Sphaerotilus natans subsp. natans DSM 6575]SIR95213.1 hypothetical protein SAMN05421778_12390 [Sphaerotilus natans]
MLRPLVMLLLAANIGFWAWSQGALDGLTGVPHDSDREPQRLAAQIAPERLEILRTELPASAAPAAPAAPASTASAADLAAEAASPASTASAATAAASALAAASAVPAEASAAAVTPPPAVPVPATPVPTVCLEAGPFNAAEWRTAQVALRRVLDDSSWTLTSREKAGTWMVYVGPYKSREIMARRADQLRQLEIAFEEARDLPDEYIPGFVFGRYGVEADARALQTRLTSQKIRYVRVVPLVRPTVSHTVRIPKADPAMRARLAALKPRLSGNAFEPCGR